MDGCGSLGDDGASALIRLLAPTLESLSLRGLLRLTRATFTTVTACSRLQSLDLSMCRSLTNGDLTCIVAACPRLQSLMLQGCVHVDDDGVAAVATHTRELERLSLEFCYNVTDAGVQLLVSECRRLRELNLKALNQLTIDAFLHLIDAKPKDCELERINIGACADFRHDCHVRSRHQAALPASSHRVGVVDNFGAVVVVPVPSGLMPLVLLFLGKAHAS
ncbi:hypothetical protein PINS_up014470 [Pythium insidiosum]|nr:hypothetical protein PINS_up014470 [Pythium insidiosum]